MNDIHATAAAPDAVPGIHAGSSTRRAARSIVGGSIGNLIEWYDFHVYTTFSIYFAASFFPREKPAALDTTGAPEMGSRPGLNPGKVTPMPIPMPR